MQGIGCNLNEYYEKMLKKYNINVSKSTEVYGSIRRAINSFMRNHKRVGIYCYGEHTKKLMVDFIFELKDIVCIIDNGEIRLDSQGFRIIKDNEIDMMNLDGIIISSFKYRSEIKQLLDEFHADIDILDFYDYLNINCGFYLIDSAYANYRAIYDAKKNIRQNISKKQNLFVLMKLYLTIKDFRLAWQTALELYELTLDATYKSLADDIYCLYDACLDVLTKSEKAVCLMCVDGLRGTELSANGYLHSTYENLKKKGTIYKNAYSYSTSTFETLVPVFMGKNVAGRLQNMSTVDAKEVSFVQHAIKQQRKIFIYGNCEYITGEYIKHIDGSLTITQILWEFILDLNQHNDGLFYLHPVYESHFTFPSPYFDGSTDIILDGTSILYDYTGTKGEKLRGNYVEQYNSAMRYLDDTLAPVFKALAAKTIFFSDHGNYDYTIFENRHLQDLNPNKLIVGQDLFHIPLAIMSPNEYVGVDDNIVSLMELNEMTVSLLDNKMFKACPKEWVQIGRTAIYNPDYKYIFSKIFTKFEYLLEEFKGFVFTNSWKLVIFPHKTILLDDKDCRIDDETVVSAYLSRIRKLK